MFVRAEGISVLLFHPLSMYAYFLQALQNYSLSPLQWSLAILAAIILGISKAGIGSISILTVTMLAYTFGSKISTGVLLPMLVVADIFAVFFFKRHTQWPHLLRMLPWMIAGVIFGAWLGKDIDEVLFKKVMAAIILSSVAVMFWREHKAVSEIPTHWSFASIMGLGTGFTSMVGNLAGGFSNVYLLSMRLPKNQFIGTAAWLFFIVNTFKLPFHIFSWKTVNADSLSINIILLPFLIGGFFVGLRIVRVIAEERYRQVILWLTAASVVLILVDL